MDFEAAAQEMTAKTYLESMLWDAVRQQHVVRTLKWWEVGRVAEQVGLDPREVWEHYWSLVSEKFGVDLARSWQYRQGMESKLDGIECLLCSDPMLRGERIERQPEAWVHAECAERRRQTVGPRVICGEPTKKGTPCQNDPLPGLSVCRVHDPSEWCGAVKANGQVCKSRNCFSHMSGAQA